MKIDLHQLVRELLTDYDDNFVGAPDEEIIEEVIECINPSINEDQLIDHILEIISNLFD